MVDFPPIEVSGQIKPQHANKLETWQERTAKNVLHRLEKDVFPLIGRHPIAEIKAPVILDVLRQIEKRGAVDMAKRQGQVCGQIFRFAIAEGLITNMQSCRAPQTRFSIR
jgi:integrase